MDAHRGFLSFFLNFACLHLTLGLTLSPSYSVISDFTRHDTHDLDSETRKTLYMNASKNEILSTKYAVISSFLSSTQTVMILNDHSKSKVLVDSTAYAPNLNSSRLRTGEMLSTPSTTPSYASYVHRSNNLKSYEIMDTTASLPINPTSSSIYATEGRSHSKDFGLFSTSLTTQQSSQWLGPPQTSAFPTIFSPSFYHTTKGRHSGHRLTLSKYEPDCNKVINQIPSSVHITEHDFDKLLFTTLHGTSVNISIGAIYPEKLSSSLIRHFRLYSPNNYTTDLILNKAVDIEQIYLIHDIVVNIIRIQIKCRDHGTMPLTTYMNITVEDIDDNGPSFENADKTTCVIPVYSAGASEEFVGNLTLSPRSIHAVDGDLLNSNIISYSFIHGEPVNYQQYFKIDNKSGNVNKTSNITADDPHDFVMIVQATETSSSGRSKVAVLTVSIAPPYESPKSNIYRANKTVITMLQVLSVIVILGFTLGFLYVIHHRNKQCKVESKNENLELQKIDDIEEYMIATSTNQVTTHIQTCAPNCPESTILQKPSLLSAPSPAPKNTPIQSPVSPRKVQFVLPEKTYRMIYGKRARNVMRKSEFKK